MTVPPVSPMSMPVITAAPPTIASTRPSRRPMALAAVALTTVGCSVTSVIPKRTALIVGASEAAGAAAGALPAALSCAAAGLARQRVKQSAQTLQIPAVPANVSSVHGITEGPERRRFRLPTRLMHATRVRGMPLGPQLIVRARSEGLFRHRAAGIRVRKEA